MSRDRTASQGKAGGGFLGFGRERLGAIFLAVALLLTIALPLGAETPRPDSPEIRRVAALGKLWGKVADLHPAIATSDVDWDAALLRALPKVRAARDRDQAAAAFSEMLAALGDPATRLVEPPRLSPPAGEPPPLVRTLEDEKGPILIVALGEWIGSGRWTQVAQQMGEITQAFPTSQAVILDLRTTSTDPSTEGFEAEITGFLLDDLAPHLVAHELQIPSFRYRLQSGYRPQEGSTSGGYSSGLYTVAGGLIQPVSPKAPARVVFLVDGSARLPLLVPALRASGEGWLVSQGPLAGAAFGNNLTMELGEGLIAEIRVSEMVPPEQGGALAADLVVPERREEKAGEADAPSDPAVDPALDAALRIARGLEQNRPPAAPNPPLAQPRFRPDPSYADLAALDLPHRQLAVIRAWNVIASYYPYVDLIGDWDAALPEFLAKIEGAETTLDYQLVLLEMTTHIPDGHTNLIGADEAQRFIGEAAPPVRLRVVEGFPTIVAASPEALAAGFNLGCQIVSVDGQSVEARIQHLQRFLTASTPAHLANRLAASLLRGPSGSTAKVLLRDPAGVESDVSMVRQTARWQTPPNGEVIQVLPNEIGYVDLTRLEPKDVEGMFERFQGTRGLVFDLRGYPRGTAWPIAPHINKKKAKIGAQFRRVQVWALSGEESQAGYFFAQPLPQGDPSGKVYTAPIVVLIDDRAISQSEHSCLFFEAAADVHFVGTPTAGANGDVTRANLPGGLQLFFTGHDVRHADGRQLQRVGIQPHVVAEPTRAGVRDGKDEVLAAGIAELEQMIAGARANN